MLEFDAWGLAMLLRHIDREIAFAEKVCEAGGRDENVIAAGLEFVDPLLSTAQIRARDWELGSTMDRVRENGPFRKAVAIGIIYQQLLNHSTVLREAIEADLKKGHFVFVPSEKAKLLEQMPSQWEAVWEKISNCRFDTEEAVYSYCLGRNTASVFHSMRVAEHGLRRIAQKVGVKLTDKGKPQPIEFATWDKVITGIRNEITAARLLPQGPRKNRKLQFYSDAAENCIYMRDIWRNEVSHTRKRYNDEEALGVLNRVRDFMQLLVNRAQ